MIRAALSAEPPAAKPTTIVMVFFGGNSCAFAVDKKKLQIIDETTIDLMKWSMTCILWSDQFV
jgi:hypothetical protein